MSISRCRVSFRDLDGLEHVIEVEAESLYEAVGLAVSEFRNDELGVSDPKTATRIHGEHSKKTGRT